MATRDLRPPINPEQRRKNVPRRSKNSRSHPKGELERVAEKHAMALELRKQGLTFREIAARMGISLKSAHDCVEAELLELREKTVLDAVAVREIDLERCDVMLKGLWPKIKKGDPAAVGAGVRVLDRRARLLGHDAPQKTELVGALAAITPEAAARMSEADIAARVQALVTRISNPDTGSGA